MIVAASVLLSIIALGFVLLVREKDLPEPIPVSPIQHLDDRKNAIYESLRDLQFEYRLGKLSDEDYQGSKQALQRELAVVLAETEATVARLGLNTARPATRSIVVKIIPTSVCPSCGAKFKQALKFCGECGKTMA